jgi:hypothetical protein
MGGETRLHQTRELKMAIQVHKGKSKAVDPNAGPVKTPPPQARDTSFGRQNYGSNAFGGPSSIAPGRSVTSPLADDLSGDDEALATVISKGAGLEDNTLNTQTRDVPITNVPDGIGMESARSRQGDYANVGRGGSIPAKLGTAQETSAPVRKPS